MTKHLFISERCSLSYFEKQKLQSYSTINFLEVHFKKFISRHCQHMKFQISYTGFLKIAFAQFDLKGIKKVSL